MNIKLLNKVWNGIKDGTYEHSQKSWHCGSAHCIAGWIEMLDTKEGCYSLGGHWPGMGTNPVLKGRTTGDYAREKLGISYFEGKMLFNPGITNGFIQNMVDIFQRGDRIYDDDGTVWGGKWSIHDGHLYVKVARKCNLNTMNKKVKEIWQGDYHEPYMSETIFTDKFERCITSELEQQTQQTQQTQQGKT